MSEIAIKAENISKAYQLGEFSTGTLSRDIQRRWALMRGKEDPYLKIGETNDRTSKGESNIVWSLKDIDFEIKQGDAVGIIGRNGAGKSTLLKVLSRVTTPTTGSIKVKGRIASLLEVGTGFHPELTGKENIFLNGAILGMRKHEIKKHFDAIVDFSAVERYIDTPVKRYSSGMYVRLAFAVAAHLESEILIVDEVLAVGDAEFQRKCLGKMNEVSKGEGRTVLFVSHNMGSINQLCNKGILLRNGAIQDYNNVSQVTAKYFNINGEMQPLVTLLQTKRQGNLKCMFSWFSVGKQGQNVLTREISLGESLVFKFEVICKYPNTPVRMSIDIKSGDGTKIATMVDVDSKFSNYIVDKNIYEVVLKDLRLYPDTYYVSLFAGDTTSSEIYDYVEDVTSFEVVDGGTLAMRPLPKTSGIIFLTPEWKIST